MNNVSLIGKLAKEINLRHTKSGKTLGMITLATRRRYPVNGKRINFLPIVLWDTLAENCSKKIGTGWLVSIKGRLELNEYTPEDGIERLTVEVVAEEVEFLAPPEKDAHNAFEALPLSDSIHDEEIPF